MITKENWMGIGYRLGDYCAGGTDLRSDNPVFQSGVMLLTVVAIATVLSPAEWHSLTELCKGYGNYKLPLMRSLVLSGSGG